MSPDTPPHSRRNLDDAVRLRRARDERGEREGRSLAQDLAAVGAVGWTIVVPPLFGIVAGRWLDRRLQSGVACTLGLLFAGVALGCMLAWRRLHSR
ncbi:MAG TPA: AtpZ/AtpI family protein [Steroidobacteraceae bacterium]|nr:AtpZ/AtpI family protein [Steroidobacteraceae bacterium]